MKNKLFTLGFSAALFLDLIALATFGFLIYSALYFTLDGYQSKFQFLVLILIAGAIFNIRNVYLDCIRTDQNNPFLRGIVYGLTGPLGWKIYYSEYYEKAKDGYFEYKDTASDAAAVSPVSKPVAWIVMTAIILFVSFICYLTFLKDRVQGDYFESLLSIVFLLFIVIYTIFNSRSAKLKKRNPLDKDAGKSASYLVLVFFVAAIAFIFYYAKYLLK